MYGFLFNFGSEPIVITEATNNDTSDFIFHLYICGKKAKQHKSHICEIEIIKFKDLKIELHSFKKIRIDLK